MKNAYFKYTKNTYTMTFIQVLSSNFYFLVEAIEHGSSDAQIIEQCKRELYEATGYLYID